MTSPGTACSGPGSQFWLSTPRGLPGYIERRAPGDAPPYPIRAAGAAVPAFVGRAAETSAAEEAWASVRAGGRQVIFIGGEPGAGKSRLAAGISSAGARQGGVV